MPARRPVDPMIEHIHQGRCPDCKAPLSWPGERGWHVCSRCGCAWKVQEIAGQLYPAFVKASLALQLKAAARSEVLP